MEQEPEIRNATLAYYEANARHYVVSTVDTNMTVLYVPFLMYMRAFASILDAGCGSGRDTLYFLKKGFQVTAFDYSPALVRLASKITGQEVLHLAFQEVEFKEQFDGIWACASLLHVPMDDMHDVISRLSRSMKVDGVLYASFKPGTGEHYRDDRLFVDFDKDGFDKVIKQHPELTVLRYWKTRDMRPGMEQEAWFNVLVRKIRPARKMTFLGVARSKSRP